MERQGGAREAQLPADRCPPAVGFLWFVPELIRQRTLLRDVAVAALVLHVLGFATPLFFQITVDKVLVHESYATLSVLSDGIVVALLFDAVFTYLRRYLLLFASNKSDVRVGTRTFQHLLRLPLAYFERRSAGVIVKHMQQSRGFSSSSPAGCSSRFSTRYRCWSS